MHDYAMKMMLAVLILITLVVSVPAQINSDDITWYTGGEAKLRLNPVPANMLSNMELSGTTTQNKLLIKVAKKGRAARSNSIPLAADGSFNVLYFLKDGIGTYTITIYGSEQKGSSDYQGLGYFTHTVKKTVPANARDIELNGKIIEFIDKVLGTTVGNGECWDLVKEALDTNLAEWTRPTTFGRPINPETTVIKAGDIIQFRSLKISEKLPGGGTKFTTYGAPDHTAVVYKVLGNKHYTLTHQNIAGKRTVIKSDTNLTKVTSGQYRVYRPVALMIRQ